jgi:hypothetical protein
MKGLVHVPFFKSKDQLTLGNQQTNQFYQNLHFLSSTDKVMYMKKMTISWLNMKTAKMINHFLGEIET